MDQLNLLEGLERKETGLALVEQGNPEFLKLMRSWARIICERKGVVSCDDLRVWANGSVIAPVSENVWGSVFREKGWKFVKMKLSEYPSNHGRRISVWTWEGV